MNGKQTRKPWGTCRRLLAGLVAVAVLGLVTAEAAINGLGVMGDSLSDEYFEETYGAYATNWTVQLAVFRGLNLGPTAIAAAQPGGTWGEPRRTGYEYNWARSGDTSSDLLLDGQYVGLASQADPQGVTHAVLAIGANDFSPFAGSYGAIYEGAWTPAQINDFEDTIITNIDTALQTVTSAGIKLVLVTVPDYGVAPSVRFVYPDDSQRERVAAVMQDLSARLRTLAQQRRVPLVDWFALGRAVFGPHTNLNQVAKIGNVDIDLLAGDFDPISHPDRTAAFVDDGIHPHTTIQGVLANAIIEAFNRGYGESVALFTEQEILAHAGLVYGGQDTLANQIGDYAQYVVLPAPSWWSGAADLGNGWRWIEWFGYFNTSAEPWIYHQQHGWLYAVGADTSSIFFWDPAMQAGTWWWTSAGTYPYLYRFSDSAWLWYQKDSTSPRWFYNLTAGNWENW